MARGKKHTPEQIVSLLGRLRLPYQAARRQHKPSMRVEDPMLSMVATRRKALRRSGASVPKARQAPLNLAIRKRISGEIWIWVVSNILGFKHIYTHISRTLLHHISHHNHPYRLSSEWPGDVPIRPTSQTRIENTGKDELKVRTDQKTGAQTGAQFAGWFPILWILKSASVSPRRTKSLKISL